VKVIVAKNYESMSRTAASIMIGEYAQDRRVNVCITGGNTPRLCYEYMKEEISGCGGFPNVHYYNFDELPILNPAGKVVSYESLDLLTREYYKPCGVKAEQIHHLNEQNYTTFDRDIALEGGLDLVVMGMGEDGHFCANLPGTTRFHYGAYNVKLSDEYTWAWLKPFKEKLGENHCDDMITMGPRTILKAGKLLLIVNGEKKAGMLKKIIEGEVTETVPSSVLKMHRNFVVLCDEEAASTLDRDALSAYS
jgi:6-phosphogluconolactonase/glucosamine-6-phosphate isomerase/deaminase